MTRNNTRYLCEAEVAEGLEQVAADELLTQLGRQQQVVLTRKGLIQFTYEGNLKSLLGLKTVIAVYLLHSFALPRPKALLGHQHFHTLLNLIRTALNLHKGETFHSLYIDAAGSDSSVMQRLKTELAAEVGLVPIGEKGDLLIRLRRSINGEGWDALVRLSPRPLATRSWRVCNFEGALNATVAQAIVCFTQPQPDDLFLNLMCGSGTLLIERLSAGKSAQVIGFDSDTDALNCAQENLNASGHKASLMQADARTIPLPDHSVTKLCADLPFGQLVGSHRENTVLYPAVLHEAARVAASGAIFVVITHEIRLMESVLRQEQLWETKGIYPVTLGGLHPRIYILHKRGALC